MADTKKYLDLVGLGYYDDKIKEWVRDQIPSIPSIKNLTLKGESGASLVFDPDSAAQTWTLGLDYNTTKAGYVTLSVKNAAGSTAIAEFDASAFVKDGMLSSAEIVTVPSTGNEATAERPAGKYIKLSWNTDAGIETTYIPVADLISEHDVVKGEDGPGAFVTVTTNVNESTGTDGQKISTISVNVDDNGVVSALGEKANKLTADITAATQPTLKETITAEDASDLSGVAQHLINNDAAINDKFANYATTTNLNKKLDKTTEAVTSTKYTGTQVPNLTKTFAAGGTLKTLAQNLLDNDGILAAEVDTLKRKSYVNTIGVSDGTNNTVSGDVKFANTGNVKFAVDSDAGGITGNVNIGVSSFGGKTGAITIDDDVEGIGNVKFNMNSNELQGTVNVGVSSWSIADNDGGAAAPQATKTIDFAESTTEPNGLYFYKDSNGYVTGKANIVSITTAEIDTLFA